MLLYVYLTVLCLVRCFSCFVINTPSDPNLTPRQIHLALHDDNTKMAVTWSTWNCTETLAIYAQSSSPVLSYKAVGNATKFTDGGPNDRVQYIHRVVLTGLTPGLEYKYKVGNGNPSLMSAEKVFKTINSSETSPLRFAVYGDMGLLNAKSLPFLINDVKANRYDVILHVGDFAYDMNTNESTVGDNFMDMVDPVACRLPYMTTVGNHEVANNFTNYKARFSMPKTFGGDGEGMFYSYNIGSIHFISISTEFYFFLQYGYEQLETQYNWLIDDLKTANLPANRKIRPWIILLGHRPMYCSNDILGDCVGQALLLRYGVPFTPFHGLDKVLYDYGVDVAIWAHEHSYERMWPVYNTEVRNGTTSKNPYHNPQATVHLVTGSAGCQESHDRFTPLPRLYSAFSSDDYGYSRMNVLNKTHLYWEQFSVDKEVVIDKILVIKEKHQPFGTS